MSKIAVVLALPAEYNTSSMIRCRAIIEALVELGHSVKCYMPNPDINSKYYSDLLHIKCIEVFRYGKVINSRTVISLSQSSNTSKKPNIMRFVYKMFKRLDVFGSTLIYLPERKRISIDISNNSFDYLLTFSDPMTAHMIGKYCKRKNHNLKYIQQWGDPLSSDTISKTAQPVWFRKIVEESLLKPADKICYVSPFTEVEQKHLFPKQAKKMVFLPTPSIEYSSCNNDEKEEDSKRLCLGYFGSYYSVARNLKPFYNVAIQTPEVDFLIVGDSDLCLKSTDNVVIRQRVSQEEMIANMKNTDVLVCLMNHKGNQIPGKVYHDASSTKDILFIKDGEYGDEIEGFFAKYNHYSFVKNTEADISKRIYGYLETGVPIRKPVSDFSARKIAESLLFIETGDEVND